MSSQKNGVDLVEASNFFFKLEKMSGKTVWPIKIKAFTSVSYHGRLVFGLFL